MPQHLQPYARQWSLCTYNQMKDNYVSNIEEVLIANQTQKNKIEFLERERIKREHYLDDLRQNLHLNKATLREMNTLGPNLAAISRLSEQTERLTEKLRSYYEQYQSINTVLLMQRQMRLQDKQFYNERMIEFENKMVDLRKYLHDKEDSFSSVVARLRKYQDLAEPELDQKLINYKKDIGESHTHQFIAEILKDKNYYKRQYEKMQKDYFVFTELRKEIVALHPDVQVMIGEFQTGHKVKIEQFVQNSCRPRLEQAAEKKESKRLKVDPNKELIRLVKKEKLSKQLFQDALNEAIQKNEQLVSIKTLYESSLEKLQLKCALLHAENTIFALRLAEYDVHYSRYATHCKSYYEQGDSKGLRTLTELRLKQYARAVKNLSDAQLHRTFEKKLQLEVQKWAQFMCDSAEVKRALDRKGILVRSCSTPNLLFGFQLDNDQENLLIEQY